MTSADDNQDATEIGLTPDADAIRQHIEWLIAPARGPYDDALIEIAYDDEAGSLSKAQLFGFNEIDKAVEFAVSVNRRKRNTYIGAALRSPDADRFSRSKGSSFYVATAVAVDIDENYDETRKRMKLVVDDGFVVTTGTKPTRRSQHWVRLTEPCMDADDYALAASGLVLHVGGDIKVRDAARVMRLGGTVSWPPPRKVAKGYTPGVTTVSEAPQAKPAHILRLSALEPMMLPYAPSPRKDGRPAPAGDIVMDGMGKIIDGRETYFRNLVMAQLIAFQEEYGCDPGVDDLWQSAGSVFDRKTYDENNFWKTPQGRRELYKRVQNTVHRLQAGELSVRSITTDKVKESRVAKAKAQLAQQGDDWGAPVSKPEPFDPPPIIPDPRVKDAKPPSPPPLVYRLPEYLSGFVPYEFLIDPIVQRAFLYSFTAQTGHGKSAVAMLMSVHVATGLDFADRKVEQGRVLYMAGENPVDIQARYIALLEALDLSDDDIQIDIIPMTFDIAEHHAIVAEHAKAVGGYSLIIVDTLMAFFKGDDDNSNTQMAVYARDQLRPLTTVEGSPAVIVLAHPRKGAGEQDLEPRGGGAFIAEMDGNLTLWKTGMEVTLHHSKMRGPGFEPMPFELRTVTTEKLKDKKGRLIPSVVAAHISSREMERREERRNELLDDVLLAVDEVLESGNDPTVAALTAILAGKLQKTAVGKYRKQLQKEGLVTSASDRRVYLTPAGTKEVAIIKKHRRREFRIDR